MAQESACCAKVRLYIECAGLIDRDTLSKVFYYSLYRPHYDVMASLTFDPRAVGSSRACIDEKQPQTTCQLRQTRADRVRQEQLEPQMEEVL